MEPVCQFSKITIYKLICKRSLYFYVLSTNIWKVMFKNAPGS